MSMQQFCFGLAKMSYLLLMACKDVIFIMFITPLVFTTTGGMAAECLRYHSRLAELIADKKAESYANTISWIRAKVSCNSAFGHIMS